MISIFIENLKCQVPQYKYKASSKFSLLLKCHYLRAFVGQNSNIWNLPGVKRVTNSKCLNIQENSCWAPGDKRVSRRSSGATEARRGSRGDFSLSLESQSGSNIVLIAVLVVFLSVLEEGSRPQVLHNKCFKISSSL